MADYSINPQFANLSGLQPLQALDLTRGGSLQFQALAPIEVVSSRPELVAQGIAGAVQGIAQGALTGITARWEKEEEREKEKRKYAHELELAGAKKKSEDLDFAEKELLKFDIANSGKADYAERRKEVVKALTGRVKDVLPAQEPSVSVTQTQEEADKEYKTKEDPKYKAALSEAQAGDLKKQILKVDAETLLPEMEGVGETSKNGKVVATYAPSETPTLISDKPVSLSLSGLQPQVQTQAQPAKALVEIKPPTESATEPQKDQPPKVDRIPLPQPEYPAEKFASRQLAEQARKSIETNPHWEFKVSDKPDLNGYFYIEPVSKFEKVTGEQRQERDDWYKQQDLLLKQQKAAQDAQKAEQDMQIRQQKIKDEDKIWAVQVEDAAKSLKAINDVISIIENNPKSVGKASASIAAFPFIDTDASRIRNKITSIQGDTAIKALTAMRLAAPTGAAVGNVSDKDMELFKASEGSLDPDTQTDKDILPVLRDIYRKRLDDYNKSVDILKNKNPEYTPPTIKYTQENKKTSKQKQEATRTEERIRVKAPYQKDGKDVFGTIPKSEVDKKLLEGFTLAPLTQ
jgi:hypothetical protein